MIAHGSDEVSKKRLIKVGANKEPLEAVTIGTALLRHAITILADKPEFLDSNKLDMTLLGGKDPPVD